MYDEYFKLSGQPFKLNPDPKFFYGSRSHNKAMAYLHYGLRQAEGFIVITGEIGAGKSMLISHLLDQLDRSRIAAAHLLTPNLKPEDLLSHILSAFRIEPANEGKAAYLEAFEDYLFDQLNHGRRVLLIVDEAQNLPVETLEELRILSNMDYDGTPLFQVFLVGQPDFRPVLAGSNMEQLRQRIIASYHLEPLSQDETKDYVEHRLAVVGWNLDPEFTDNAFVAIFNATGGVPRRINKLCNRLLLFCSLEEQHVVNQEVVQSVASDLDEENVANVTRREVEAEDGAAARANKAQASLVDTPKKEEDGAASAIADDSAKGTPTSSDDEEAKAHAKPSQRPVVVPFEAVRKVKVESAPEKQVPLVAQKTETTKEQASDTNAASHIKNEEEGAMDLNNEPLDKKSNAGVAEDLSQMSAFDRLRLQREAKSSVEKKSSASNKSSTDKNPSPATLHDVANAIAAASIDKSTGDLAEDVCDADIANQSEGDDDEFSFAHDPKGWRQTMVRSIKDTQDELKKANTNLSRVRRSVSEIEKRRRDKNMKIDASLVRAETLLSEIRDAWR